MTLQFLNGLCYYYFFKLTFRQQSSQPATADCSFATRAASPGDCQLREGLTERDLSNCYALFTKKRFSWSSGACDGRDGHEQGPIAAAHDPVSDVLHKSHPVPLASISLSHIFRTEASRCSWRRTKSCNSSCPLISRRAHGVNVCVGHALRLSACSSLISTSPLTLRCRTPAQSWSHWNVS
jgi:hypothetical protein